MESFRKQDMKLETELGSFLDEYLYPDILKQYKAYSKFIRIKDRQQQLQGIDVIIENGNKSTINIDEKASVYYSNAMIPTFAFEINSYQRDGNEPVIGWLLNDNLKTDYYNLMWPNVKCIQNNEREWIRKPLSEIRKPDFTIIESMMINKKKLIERIEKDIVPKFEMKLLEYATKIRRNDLVLTNNKVCLATGYNIVYTENLKEKPINLVIKKNILSDVADAIYLISQDGSARIK